MTVNTISRNTGSCLKCKLSDKGTKKMFSLLLIIICCVIYFLLNHCSTCWLTVAECYRLDRCDLLSLLNHWNIVLSVRILMSLCGCVSGMWDPHPPSRLAGGDTGDSLQDDLCRCGIQPETPPAGCAGGPGLPHTFLQYREVDLTPEAFVSSHCDSCSFNGS